jgi:hypothetical protein
MRHIILLSVARLTLPYPAVYLINGTMLQKQITAHKICVLILSVVLVLSISHSKKNSARCYQDVRKSSCKVLVILVTF